MKMSDATDQLGPQDPLKLEYHKKKSKYNITNKVNEENHWDLGDCISDPEVQRGWKPQMRWTEEEKNYRCQGIDRPFRTFDKIDYHYRKGEATDADRERKMEELIIK